MAVKTKHSTKTPDTEEFGTVVPYNVKSLTDLQHLRLMFVGGLPNQSFCAAEIGLLPTTGKASAEQIADRVRLRFMEARNLSSAEVDGFGFGTSNALRELFDFVQRLDFAADALELGILMPGNLQPAPAEAAKRDAAIRFICPLGYDPQAAEFIAADATQETRLRGRGGSLSPELLDFLQRNAEAVRALFANSRSKTGIAKGLTVRFGWHLSKDVVDTHILGNHRG